MRIAMFCDSYHPTVDGMVSLVDTEKKFLEQLGHEVHIVAPDPGAEHRLEGVHYIPAKEFKSYKGYYVPKGRSHTTRLVKEIQPDIIHAHGIAMVVFKGFISAWRLKVPFVTTMGTMVTDTMDYYLPFKLPKKLMKKLSWIYIKSILQHSDACIAPTRPILDELKEQGLRPKREGIIPGGVNVGMFYPRPPDVELRDSLGIKETDRVLMFVGRLSFEKHVEEIVQCLKLLPDDVHLIVDGDGPAEELVRSTIDELGLRDRAHMIGMVPRAALPGYFSLADLTVSASRFETQCLGVQECMACGVPAVAPAARAFLETLADCEGAFMYEGGIDDMAATITEALKVCRDEPVRKAAVERANSYSEESSARKLADLYQRVISEKKKHPKWYKG